MTALAASVKRLVEGGGFFDLVQFTGELDRLKRSSAVRPTQGVVYHSGVVEALNSYAETAFRVVGSLIGVVLREVNQALGAAQAEVDVVRIAIELLQMELTK